MLFVNVNDFSNSESIAIPDQFLSTFIHTYNFINTTGRPNLIKSARGGVQTLSGLNRYKYTKNIHNIKTIHLKIKQEDFK